MIVVNSSTRVVVDSSPNPLFPEPDAREKGAWDHPIVRMLTL